MEPVGHFPHQLEQLVGEVLVEHGIVAGSIEYVRKRAEARLFLSELVAITQVN
jgi:hypothetical protein